MENQYIGKTVVGNTFFIWKNLIAVKPPAQKPVEAPAHCQKPEDFLPYLKHIAPYARWNDKMGAYLLPLGKQNLQRLKAQFPDITMTGGHHILGGLKERWNAWRNMVDTAEKIKSAIVLPDLQCKVPPLAHYQKQAVHFLLNVPSAPLFADCGSGKTYACLVSCAEHIRDGIVAAGKTLVCGKLSTLFSGWLEDAKKFTDLKVVCLWIPSNYKRKEKILKLLEEPADIYIINHDGVKIYEEALAAKRFDKVIVDESTVLKSFRGTHKSQKGGSFGKALLNVAEHAKWRVIMSGTPAPNGPADLWGQFKFLDPDGFTLEPTFGNFKHRYMEEKVFGKQDNPEAPRTWVMRPESVDQVGELVRPLTFRVRLRDHLKDLPPLTSMTRSMYMAPGQETHYRDLAVKFFTEVDGEEINVTTVLAQLAKFRQVTGGFLYDVLKEAHSTSDWNPKLEALDDLLRDEIDPTEKVVVFAQYEHEIRTILARYKDLEPVSAFGGNSSATNLRHIDMFINDPKTRLIVLHPKSTAHGITLTVARYTVFYSLSFSSEEDYQAVKRIERASQKRAMYVYYLLCKESVDEYIYEVIQKKHASQERLIDGETERETNLELAQKLVDHLRKKYPGLGKIKNSRKSGQEGHREEMWT